MKTKSIVLVTIFLGFAGVFGLAQQVVEEIVAVVNDNIITLTQYRREFEAREQALKAQFQQAQGQISQEELTKAEENLKAQLLDSMVTDVLLLQLAKDKNLNVTDQVKNVIENIKKENHIESDDDLRRALQSQGLEWEPWLKQLEEGALRQAILYTEVNRSITIDDSEVVEYYKKHQSEFIEPEEYKVRAVYLSAENVDPAALEARRKDIDEKIKSGGDFAEVSGTYSDEPLKDSKGDLGTLKKGEVDKTLQAAVDRLKKGEISGWIQAKNGWYLLKLEDKKESRLLSFDEAKKAIEEKIFNDKQGVKVKEFLDNLRKNSYVKIVKPNPLGV